MEDGNINFLKTLFEDETVQKLEEFRCKNPDIAELMDSYAISKVWKRKGLALREKSLITISSQIAAHKWDQVEIHMRSFLFQGGTVEELKEVCIHLSVYCGFPTMLSAREILDKISSNIE